MKANGQEVTQPKWFWDGLYIARDKALARVKELEEALLKVHAAHEADNKKYVQRIVALEEENFRMAEALRWVPVGEKLPDDELMVDLVVIGDERPGESGEELIRGYHLGDTWFYDDGEPIAAHFIPLFWRDIPMCPDVSGL